MPYPAALLTVVVEELALRPRLLGLCAGYERNVWRSEQFAEYLTSWLLDFVFDDEQQDELDSFSARRALRQAARTIYQTDRYQRRGEFGELLLHVILRQHFSTVPVIRKIYFKDSPNDTVKGFDSVHIVKVGDGFELWLGEVKFYKDLAAAIRDVVVELKAHSKTDYLREEFALILNKTDPSFPHFERLKSLLDPNTSLDAVFKRIRVPVLLTYDSEVTARHTSICEEYRREITAELKNAHAAFLRKTPPVELVVNLIIVPLSTKNALMSALNEKLRGLQR